MFAPELLVQTLVTNLRVKLYKKNEVMIESGNDVDELYFINVGVAHLYGYCEWKGETYRFKSVTLKKGSWFGDY